MESEHQTLVIIDFGSQYTQLIARRARELGIYSIILPFTTNLKRVKKLKPMGLILSGGPSSVYGKFAPSIDPSIFEMGIPVLGICYGMQLITKALGGKVEASKNREYGFAELKLIAKSQIIINTHKQKQIWMSHGDHVAKPPAGFIVTAKSDGLVCAIESKFKKIYGLQFHPEVSHTTNGSKILENFLVKICKFNRDWTAKSFIVSEKSRIKNLVGQNSVICALSGGVDSSVAATLVNKAIGKQQTCVFVDTGLLRKGEYEEVLAIYSQIGLNVKPIRAEKVFLQRLQGITNPEKKRKIIGAEFIKIFEAEAKKISDAKFLVQGTLYPDVIESVSVHGPSATIKSHHNVGGLPKKMNLNLLEPLSELFKDEVRSIGRELGLPEKVTQRQPFPGPGLAVRILGEVTANSVKLLQEADSIVRKEIDNSGGHERLWQYFAVLLPVKTVGVMGDKRTYQNVVAIRAVESTDGMTANWAELPHELLQKISSKIISEVRGVNRVVYDITSKPPGTIEWE